MGSQATSGLPSAAELAQTLADECGYPGFDRTNLLRIAQYYELKHDFMEPRSRIRSLLTVPNVEPSFVHRTLARMPFPVVVTTNFDSLMERAFREVGKEPTVQVYSRRGPAIDVDQQPSELQPLVYKLHGSLERYLEMIVTEEDIVDFLACLLLGEPPLPNIIKALFVQKSILFIGYGLKDWNVRVMLRAIRERKISGLPASTSFAIQRRPAEPHSAQEWDESIMFLQRREQLECYDMDAAEFVEELKGRYEAGEGDLSNATA